jgi:hypothetical protein
MDSEPVRPPSADVVRQHQVRPQLDEVVVDDHVEADVIVGPLGEHLLVDPSTIVPIVEVIAMARTAPANTQGQLRLVAGGQSLRDRGMHPGGTGITIGRPWP